MLNSGVTGEDAPKQGDRRRCSLHPDMGYQEPPALGRALSSPGPPGSPAEVQQPASALGRIFLLLLLAFGVPHSLGCAGTAPWDALGQGGAGQALQAPRPLRCRAGTARRVWGRQEVLWDTARGDTAAGRDWHAAAGAGNWARK